MANKGNRARRPGPGRDRHGDDARGHSTSPSGSGAHSPPYQGSDALALASRGPFGATRTCVRPRLMLSGLSSGDA